MVTRMKETKRKITCNIFSTNLLVIFIIGMLSKQCEPVITHVCKAEGKTQLVKVSSQNDIWLATLSDDQSTPQSEVGNVTRMSSLIGGRRHADYSKVYKEASKAKDDLGRKRLKMDEELLQAQMETMKQEAAAQEKRL